MMRTFAAFGLAFFCLTLLAGPLDLRAAPPANDQCSGAEIIPGDVGPSPYYSSIVTNIHEATVIGDPPPPTNCYGGQISRSIWYKFTPLQSSLYTVSLKFTATTLQDSLLGIYTSPSACGGPFTQYACNDDVGTLQSAITTNFNAGTTYYMVVWHTLTNAPPEGQRSVQLKVTKVVPPANDFCEGAEEIPPSGPFPYWTHTNNTHVASTVGDPPGALCSTGRRSVWYHFRPNSGGQYIIATCTNNTATKIYNTMMAVYTNSAGSCSGNMMQMNCNPGFCGTSAALIMQLEPQRDYYVVVWDVDAEPLPDETDVQLFIDQQGPPIVTTLGHSNAQPTSVYLIGAANPKGQLTRGYFEWSTISNVYNNITAPSSTLGGGIVDFPYSRALLNLAPGTTVYYRAVAFNSFGTVRGAGKSVTLPLHIDSVTMEGNDLQILFTGSDAYNYEVQYSTDLKTWARLGDGIPLDP
ncbi:MAG TPA: hypothetical protein VJ063_01395, partial [Verrucomicrobiae bacterium]|nr:hypothetical protein [Verrucomicrobiae bacterium]